LPWVVWKGRIRIYRGKSVHPVERAMNRNTAITVCRAERSNTTRNIATPKNVAITSRPNPFRAGRDGERLEHQHGEKHYEKGRCICADTAKLCR